MALKASSRMNCAEDTLEDLVEEEELFQINVGTAVGEEEAEEEVGEVAEGVGEEEVVEEVGEEEENKNIKK